MKINQLGLIKHENNGDSIVALLVTAVINIYEKSETLKSQTECGLSVPISRDK